MKIVESRGCEVLESNWKPNMEIKEGTDLDLRMLVSKACNIKDFILLKDGKKLVDTEAVKLTLENRNDENGIERCEVIVHVKEAIPPDAGKYRLVYVDDKKKETELGASNLKVFI